MKAIPTIPGPTTADDIEHEQRVKRWMTVVSLTCVVGFVLLFLLIHDGAIFGIGPQRSARILMSTAVVVFAGSVLRLRRYDLFKDSTQASVLALFSLAAAAWGGVGLLVPTPPADASAPPCAGVPLTAGGQLVQVRPDGVNVRSEPSVVASQVGRLAGACTIAVDGFCLGGTPLHDAVSRDLVDIRWFRIARVHGPQGLIARRVSGDSGNDRFVAAATITSFVTDRLVPRLPDKQCHTTIPVPDPGHATITQGAVRPDGLTPFLVSAPNTFEFGVSLFIDGPLSTGNPYRKVTTWSRPNDASLQALWNSAATGSYLTKPTTVVVFGGSCYSIGAAMPVSRSPATLAYKLTPDGTLTPTRAPKLSQTQLKLLAATACREDNP